jgi:hypothetical protein
MRVREGLREAVRALRVEAPSELRLRRLRARVLRDAAHPVEPTMASTSWHRGGVALAVAFAVAVGAVGITVTRHPESSQKALPAAKAPEAVAAPATLAQVSARNDPEEPFAGSVEASGAARWSQQREEGIERVVLEDGALHVHVRHQVLGERFLVALPDGEIEVRGTTFDVSVEHGATRRVHVEEGVVELRLRGREVLRLSAADEWTASPAAVVRALPTSPSASASPVSGRPSRTVSFDSAAAYANAMSLLRSGRNEDAAAAFDALVIAAPLAPEAEDASFLEAIALARAGRSDAAALAADHHLALFPRSFHRKEASILAARAARP